MVRADAADRLLVFPSEGVRSFQAATIPRTEFKGERGERTVDSAKVVAGTVMVSPDREVLVGEDGRDVLEYVLSKVGMVLVPVRVNAVSCAARESDGMLVEWDPDSANGLGERAPPGADPVLVCV